MPPETIAEPAAAPPAADDDAEMSLPFELAPASFTASRVAKTTSESRGSKIMLWLIIGGMGFVVALVAVIFAVGKFHELITPDSGGSDPATLLARLKSEDSGTRRDAADAILRSGPKTLIHALDDITVVDNDRLAISQNGLHALAALGSDLVSPLTSALHSDSATARAGAARVLREMGTNGKGAAAALGDCLDDKQRVVRLTAVDTLTDLGPDAAPAVDRLAASMTCSDPEVRRKAAKALGKIGSGAKSAVAALNMAARTAPPDYKTELEARAALKAIDPDGASAHVLEHASPEIQDLVHALISSESTADERVTAANTLGAKGHEGAVAIPILYKFVRDEKDKSLRLTAAEALGHFGAEAYYVAPGLDAIAASADGEVAAAVRAALESIRAKK
jgi:HEAT repeat protein